MNSNLDGLIKLIDELRRVHPRKATVVELRYFCGMAVEDVAAELGVSKSTVEADWKLARVWLYKRLEDNEYRLIRHAHACLHGYQLGRIAGRPYESGQLETTLQKRHAPGFRFILAARNGKPRPSRPARCMKQLEHDFQRTVLEPTPRTVAAR